MDLSGSAFGIALPYSASAAFGEDAGSGDVDMLRPSVLNTLQYQTNQVATIAPDARDVLRPFSYRLRNTLSQASEDLTEFLRPAATDPPAGPVPCIDRHNAFLRGLNTAGFLSSPSWMKRNVCEVVDKNAILADISGVLGMSLSDLRSKLETVMAQYLPTIETMDNAYKRLDAKLSKLDDVTQQLMALPPLNEDFGTAILNYASSQFEENKLQGDYEEFCKNYAKFQAYRSILALPQGLGNGGAPTCVICMTESVACAVIPCGHTFCSKCAQTQRSMCYLCRTPVREKQRLYFT
jgi:hypothetical protein